MNRSFHRIALATLVLCAATGASAQDKTLRLLTWGGYAPKDVMEQFTKETGIQGRSHDSPTTKR